MSEHRSALIGALRNLIDGGDITNEQLYATFPKPEDLRGAERKAWHGLSYWADDDDIRAKDPAYAPSRRKQLAKLLGDLQAD